MSKITKFFKNLSISKLKPIETSLVEETIELESNELQSKSLFDDDPAISENIFLDNSKPIQPNLKEYPIS